jgi:hypothetical protein
MPREMWAGLENTVDDSKVNDWITQDALETFNKIYPTGGWKKEDIDCDWTGIIGRVS